jgi:hypothetical protein
MPQQSVRNYHATCVKVTRLAPRTPRARARPAAELTTPNYRRPLKTGNIVQTSVNALMAMKTGVNALMAMKTGMNAHMAMKTGMNALMQARRYSSLKPYSDTLPVAP